MKWIGALLFIAVTTLLGFEWSHQLTKRPQHIRQLKNALQILEAEILYSQLPLKDVFQILSRQIPKPTGDLFKNLYEAFDQPNVNFIKIWEEQVKKYITSSFLGIEEQEILRQFGQTLGQHDFTQQQKQIHLAIIHLEREMEVSRDRAERYGQMTRTLGFLAGIFIVLLFI